MRGIMTKYVLPLLVVFLLGSVSFALASTQEDVGGHAGGKVAVAVETDHGAATVETPSGATVQDGHGAVESAHGASRGLGLTKDRLMNLFWRAVNFIALLIILIYFLARPIGNALAGRQQQVIDELETLQDKRDTAERSYKDFESRLAGMEKEMEVIVERAIAQAENEKTKILEDAENAAEDIKRQAEAAVQGEIVEAKRKLRDDIADQAAAMAEELIVKNLTPEDQVKITEQYLDRVGTV